MVKVCQQTLDKRVLWRRRQALKQPKNKQKKKKNNNTKTAISYTKPNTTPQKTKGIFLFVYFLVCSLGLTLMRERGMVTEDGRWRWRWRQGVCGRRVMGKRMNGRMNPFCALFASLCLFCLLSQASKPKQDALFLLNQQNVNNSTKDSCMLKKESKDTRT